MFTGIITAIGDITQISPKGDGLHLTVTTPANYLDDVVIGDSIAMNGACMTVTTMQAHTFEVDVSK
jgi:riboflavin synthase